MSDEKEYILGTGADELERLGIQHGVWTDRAQSVWRQAGIGPGSRVLDLGCGPGYGSFDLAQLVGANGFVLAVDESPNFVAYVNAQAQKRETSQLRAIQADAQALSQVVTEKFDAVYCRWVLCWLKEPQRALRETFEVLRPGGRLIIHDYFNWKSMSIGPRSQAVEEMVLAAVQSFESRHGNVDLAGHLLGMLRRANFGVLHFDISVRIPRGGGKDPALDWPLTWWRSYGPKLVSGGWLSAGVYEQAVKDLDQLEKDPDQFFFCPPLFEFIALKPL